MNSSLILLLPLVCAGRPFPYRRPDCGHWREARGSVHPLENQAAREGSGRQCLETWLALWSYPSCITAVQRVHSSLFSFHARFTALSSCFIQQSMSATEPVIQFCLQCRLSSNEGNHESSNLGVRLKFLPQFSFSCGGSRFQPCSGLRRSKAGTSFVLPPPGLRGVRMMCYRIGRLLLL